MERKNSDRTGRRAFLTCAVVGAVGGVWPVSEGVLGAEPSSWGDLTGRLVYDGPPPLRKRLKVDKDLDCCGKFDIRDESLMVGPDGGLGGVLVYLRTRKVTVHPGLADAVSQEVLLDNRDCIFQPHLMTLWIGPQSLRIVNSDPVAQNVAFSPLGDMPANIVLPVGAKGVATWRFRRRQAFPVPIACNYHPWESAYILPRDDPYMAITGCDGAFRITKLPTGSLEFQLWHERCGPLDTPTWPKGRLTVSLHAGTNDLGVVKLRPSLFERRGAGK